PASPLGRPACAVPGAFGDLPLSSCIILEASRRSPQVLGGVLVVSRHPAWGAFPAVTELQGRDARRVRDCPENAPGECFMRRLLLACGVYDEPSGIACLRRLAADRRPEAVLFAGGHPQSGAAGGPAPGEPLGRDPGGPALRTRFPRGPRGPGGVQR